MQIEPKGTLEQADAGGTAPIGLAVSCGLPQALEWATEGPMLFLDWKPLQVGASRVLRFAPGWVLHSDAPWWARERLGPERAVWQCGPELLFDEDVRAELRDREFEGNTRVLAWLWRHARTAIGAVRQPSAAPRLLLPDGTDPAAVLDAGIDELRPPAGRPPYVEMLGRGLSAELLAIEVFDSASLLYYRTTDGVQRTVFYDDASLGGSLATWAALLLPCETRGIPHGSLTIPVAVGRSIVAGPEDLVNKLANTPIPQMRREIAVHLGMQD